MTDLDSERGLANTTIAEDGYAPLVHGVWVVCWGEWEKQTRRVAQAQGQSASARDDRCGG
jgi:hypothetical protein